MLGPVTLLVYAAVPGYAQFSISPGIAANGTNAPDPSPAEDEYRYDDGESNGGFGLTDPRGGVIAWLHLFMVTDGNETITQVSTAFWRRCSNGVPFGAGVWSDPDQDGHPSDGALLSKATGLTRDVGTDTFVPVDIPDLNVGPVGTKFFVVMWIGQGPGEFPVPEDSSQRSLGRAWMTGENGATFDPEGFNPALGWFEMDEAGFPCVFLLRGSAISAECTGREKLKAKCKDRGGTGRLKAKLKKAQPGMVVTFRLDADPATDVQREIDNRGKAKHKAWLSPGPHTVEILECNTAADFICP